jgi:glucokinase
VTAPVAVGVDVGGTKLLALAVDADGEVVGRQRLTTPRADADALVEALVEAASELASGVPVGVGVAGIVTREGDLRYAPNLQLQDVALGRRLEDELGVRAAVRNDVTVALHGEWQVGAGRGSDDVVMVTLGTGVGGAVVADGRLIEGAHGLGGEIGHIPVRDGGRPCPCGNRGCLEAYASGTAVAALARERLEDGDEHSALRELDEIDGKAVTLAAIDDDPLALEVLRESGYWLGVGLVALVNIFDPEVVLIGGGAATLSAPIVLPEAEGIVAERILGADHRDPPPVRRAALGDDAGAIGAALLARDLAGA